MKTHMIKAAAVAGILTVMATPSNAEHSDLGFSIRVGATVVSYDDGYRAYDRYGRYERGNDYSRKYKKRHGKHHHRRGHAHDKWHRYNDGRRDRYYDHDHWHLHDDLRHRHRYYHRGR